MINYKYLIALLIILVIVSTYFFIYPGIFVIKGSDLVGYWSDKSGNVYNIKLINGNPWQFAIDNIPGKVNGTIFGCKVIFNGRSGTYDVKNRSIIFSEDNIWYKL